MKLTLDQIKPITKGAARIEEENGAVHFYRFTEEQEELYKQTSADFYKKSFATAGVRLEFMTDSPTFSMEVEVRPGSSRKFFAQDIYVNETLVSSFGSNDTTNGIFSHTCELGDGAKKVCVYFPWSATSSLRHLELADGCEIKPVSKSYTMLMYGDSITQGYDAAHPSLSYASRLTDLLDAESVNRGIGGERFFPALAELSGDIAPDLITVAYGTNDWSKDTMTTEKLEKNCAEFYGALSRLYPEAKIFAITPIWRKDGDRITAVGSFESVAAIIRRATDTLSNVTVIDGYDFVPKDSAYFADLRLHPNDEGFAHYAENLYTAIKKYL